MQKPLLPSLHFKLPCHAASRNDPSFRLVLGLSSPSSNLPSFPLYLPCPSSPSALPSDPELYKGSQGQRWASGSHLPSCCCWRPVLPISQPTIPRAACPKAFRLSRTWIFWILSSMLCFMRPWAITGKGQGTSDVA